MEIALATGAMWSWNPHSTLARRCAVQRTGRPCCDKRMLWITCKT